MTISVVRSGRGEAHHRGEQHTHGIEVIGPRAQTWALATGQRLLFGRGPGVDLTLAPNPWVSRVAGEIAVLDEGVRVTNVSIRHPLWLEVGGDRVRLPVIASGSGHVGCLIATGRAAIGPGEVPDREESVQVILPRREALTAPAPVLDPYTKEFMVAFLLCRPWLLDPLRIRPLPSAPRIAEEALAITGSYRQWDRFTGERNARQRLAAQVHEHLRSLRARIRRHALTPDQLDLGMPVIAAVLIHHGFIGQRHLELIHDRAWLTAQEDKWWSTIA